MMKAGILEIADIMIINKCDRKGAEFIETQLQTWLDLLPKERTWKPPILKVQANRDIGLEELYAAMLKHRTHIENGNLSSREIEHRKLMVLSLAVAMFRGHCEELLDSESTNQALGTIIQKLKEPSFNAVANATNLLTMFRDSTKL
jgi:LAO/AO transport system kinase